MESIEKPIDSQRFNGKQLFSENTKIHEMSRLSIQGGNKYHIWLPEAKLFSCRFKKHMDVTAITRGK